MNKRSNYNGQRVCLILALLGLMSGLTLPAYSRSQRLVVGLAVSHLPATASFSEWPAPVISRARLGAEADSWMAINTGLISLDVRTLVIDPVNATTIYAGSRVGVCKSTDGGANWRQSGLLGNIIFPLKIDSANPNILYAGIKVEGGCHFSKLRLLKSSDGGTSWNDSISPPINGCDLIHSLELNPAEPNTLYVANFDDIMGDTWTPLIKSPNRGASWIPLYGPPFASLAIDPHQPNTLYGGTFDFPYLGYDGWDYRNGVLKSADGGASWNTTGLTMGGVNALAIDPINSSILYAATSGFCCYPLRPHNFKGLFKSVDSGASWIAINNGLTQLIGTSSTIAALVIHPSNPNVLYAGSAGAGVFKSIDGGAHWSLFNDGLTNLDIRALALTPGNPNTLYAATAGGVFKISEFGQPTTRATQVFGSGGSRAFQLAMRMSF
jgi:hypothetical protein